MSWRDGEKGSVLGKERADMKAERQQFSEVERQRGRAVPDEVNQKDRRQKWAGFYYN